jgi:UDP-glucose 4-epimerase
MLATCSIRETASKVLASNIFDAVTRIVVTGGAGFIGANLCRQLSATFKGQRLVVLDDLSTGRRENLAAVPGAEVHVGTILSPEDLDAAFAGADAVVHLAARPSVPRSIQDPVATHEVNATGTIRVLEAARRTGNPYVIVASSSSVYGANPRLPKSEDMATMPMSPYAASKLATESYALSYAASFGMDVLALRFFNVFGPLQPAGHAYAAVVPAFVSAALAGDPLPIHGDGTQTRDFTFVESVTQVLADAIQRRVTSTRPVNLAFGTRVSLLQLVETLEGVVGRALPRAHGDNRPGDVRDSQADQGQLRALFPDVTPVGLEEGLRKTVEWFSGLESMSA